MIALYLYLYLMICSVLFMAFVSEGSTADGGRERGQEGGTGLNLGPKYGFLGAVSECRSLVVRALLSRGGARDLGSGRNQTLDSFIYAL
jgi:hypothetical protein